ncbi:MAG TPA: hypothetical protein PK231_04750 [Acidocella sp.]|nr:hypothetical protein [Acidocella sp.]
MTPTTPLYAKQRQFSELTGIGRSKIYEHLKNGDFRAIKNGRSTLIDVPHALEFLSSRQPLTCRGSKSKIAA